MEKKKNNSLKELCISFMIFRTGSVLIVGKCDTINIIQNIYNFIKNILKDEYLEIYSKNTNIKQIKEKTKRFKKKKIICYDL